MEIFSFKLMSKNNKRTGIYIYSPIVKVGDKYFFAKCITRKSRTNKKDVDVNELTLTREVPEEYRSINKIPNGNN